MNKKKKFSKVMGEWKAGDLKSSSGDPVKYPKDKKRALAIAFSESGQSNPKHEKGGVAENPKTKKRLGNKIKTNKDEKITLYSFFGGFLRKSDGSVFPPFPNVDMDWTDDKTKVEKLYNEAGLNYFDKEELRQINDVDGVIIFEIKSIDVPKNKWENRKSEALKNGYGSNWNEMLSDEVDYNFKEVKDRAIHLDGEIVGKNELAEYVDIMRKGGKIKTNSMKAWGLTEQEWNWREKINEKLKKSKGEEHRKLMEEYNESDVAKKIRNKMLNKEKGGEVENEGVDLFEDYENIPAKVQKILDKYSEGFENGDYAVLKKAHNELEKIGYTFEYYVDGLAYDLRKIGEVGKVEAMEKSGSMAKGGELKEKLPKEAKQLFGDSKSVWMGGAADGMVQHTIKYKLDKSGKIIYTLHNSMGHGYVFYETTDFKKALNELAKAGSTIKTTRQPIKSEGSSMGVGGKVGDRVKFVEGMGYWDLTKYPYGGDFRRFKGGEEGVLIEGTIKIGGEMKVKLDDGRIIIATYGALDLPTHQEKDELYERNKHLWTFGREKGGITNSERNSHGYYIYVTPQNTNFKPHIWVEGGWYPTKESAEKYAVQLRKNKQDYDRKIPFYSKVEVLPATKKENEELMNIMEVGGDTKKLSRGQKDYNKEVDAYEWYVIRKSDNHVESGFQFRNDAKDLLNDFEKGEYKIINKRELAQMGIENPNEKWKSLEKGGNVLINYHNELEAMTDEELKEEYEYEFGVDEDGRIEDERDDVINELVSHYKTVLKSRGEMAHGGEINNIKEEITILKDSIGSQVTDDSSRTAMKKRVAELEKLLEEVAQREKAQRNVTIPANSFWVAIDEKYANPMRNHLNTNNIKFTSRIVNRKYTVFVDSQELLDRVVAIYNLKRVKGKDKPVSAAEVSGKSEKGGKLWEPNADKKEIAVRNKAKRMGLGDSLSEDNLKKIEGEGDNWKKRVEIVRTKKRFAK